MFHPLDSQKTKKNPSSIEFYRQQSYFSQIVTKKAKVTRSFAMKNSQSNNNILGFSF